MHCEELGVDKEEMGSGPDSDVEWSVTGEWLVTGAPTVSGR